ncbi:beta-carotene 15,15'-monooxygenase [Pedobacter sp. HMF7647]|uniref:Beta-carotene 15,15'-monooxygenase n=1 Tax=Hufsiella arboris TaxID=2695275 RepID=A0A7K1YAS7_9SPHI|nr:beta-carotene 15,15'-monooxygenase [Hufsiella arboris]MXV51682.1 beta-carotene 15,15'-monooxygenase [Hufsiella arboris]
MINQFRKLNPVNLLLLVLVAFVLRIGFFYSLPEKIEISMEEPISKLISNEALQLFFTPLSNVLSAMILTIAQAILFNKIVNEHNLLGKPSFLPALMFVTVSSILPPFLIISAPLLCNFMSLWIISKFLKLYRNEDALSVMFDEGMIVAAGTMIYFPFIAMLLLLWVSLVIFRPFNWREWIAALLGFITVYFFVAVYYYWHDMLGSFYYIWKPLTQPVLTNIPFKLNDYLPLIPLAVICLISSFALRQVFFKSFVQVRKAYQVFFFMFLLALVSVILKTRFDVIHFLLCVSSVAILIAYYFLQARKRWIYESLYLILVGFIIYFQVF